MKVKELYEEVAQLGFEDSLENTERFFQASNRAILQVNSLRPAIGSYVINHKKLDNEITEDTFCPVDKKEDICFEATDVKSYYFEADGNGKAIIELCNGDNWSRLSEITLSGNHEFKAYKGFIKNGDNFVTGLVRIRFTGEFVYSIKNIAMYKYLYSNSILDIPSCEPYAKYDMSKLVSDFLVFAAPPILQGEENTYLNQGYALEGEKTVLIPSYINGPIKILYKRLPRKLVYENNPAEDETVIDLDEELASLLPSLVASFIWAEDEPNLANYYMNIYREWAARIEILKTDYSSVVIKNSNGW